MNQQGFSILPTWVYHITSIGYFQTSEFSTHLHLDRTNCVLRLMACVPCQRCRGDWDEVSSVTGFQIMNHYKSVEVLVLILVSKMSFDEMQPGC